MTTVLLTLLGLLSATLLVGIWIGPALIGIGIVMLDLFTSRPTMRQIGRASCRERVYDDV